jgi:hypothetical protein
LKASFCLPHEIEYKNSFLIPTSLFFQVFTPLDTRNSYFQSKLGYKNTSVFSQTINGNLGLQKVIQKSITTFTCCQIFPFSFIPLASETQEILPCYLSPLSQATLLKSPGISYLHLNEILSLCHIVIHTWLSI